MKTAAVIGTGSMLGRQLASRLRKRGIKVLTAGRTGRDDIFLDLGKAELGSCDGLRADVIFHCAAAFADDSLKGLKDNFDVNAQGALTAGALAERLEATIFVYAGSAFSAPGPGVDMTKIGAYGLTKAIGEQVLGWIMERQQARFCSLRFSQIYDTDGVCCHHQPWFGRIIAYASRGEDIRMPPSLGPRNFLHVEDAADLMIRAAMVPEAKDVMDVVHPESLTCQDIATIAYNVFACGGNVVAAPEKTPFREIHFADGRPAFGRLGLAPAIDMRGGIAMIKAAGTAQAFGPMDIT